MEQELAIKLQDDGIRYQTQFEIEKSAEPLRNSD
jgi:hypothetical protein